MERSGRYIPWAVFLLALVLRLFHVLQLDASPLFAHPAVDSLTYAEHAARLAAGNWPGYGEGPFWQPPLYPYFLGLLKTFFPQSFFYAVRFVQALLGALSCVLLYVLGSHLFRPAVGAGAALGAALCGTLIFFDGELLPASLATFLDLAGLVLLLRALRHHCRRTFLAAGLLFGLAALAVPTVLGFVLAAALWLCWRRGSGGRGRAAIFLLGAVLVIAPVTLRNFTIGNDAVLISHNGGINFYIGNNPDYDRTLNLRPGWEWDELIDMPYQAGIQKPSRKSRFYFARSWEYIRTQPFDWLRLLGRKFFLFWHGDEIGRNQDIYFWRNYSTPLSLTLWKAGVAFPFGVLAPLALLGMLLAARQQGLSPPLLFVAVYGLCIIAFFVTARYRAPLLPLFALFAAHGGHWLYTGLRQHHFKSAGLGLGICILSAIPTNFQLPPMDMSGNAAIHYNLGNALARAGRSELARREFSRSVALDSTYWQAWLNLGALEGVQGDMRAAAQIFARVGRANPRRHRVWLNLAHAHVAMGDRDAALNAYRRSLAARPQQREVYIELIQFFLQEGDERNAEKILQQALQYHPTDAARLRQLYLNTRARNAKK